MRKNRDIFIYTLSSKQTGRVKYEDFNYLFKRTCPSSKGSYSEDSKLKEAKRLLQASAICEFDYERRIVELCEPGFILLPKQGFVSAILVGARDKKIIANIKSVCRESEAIFQKIEQQSTTLDMASLIQVDCLNLASLKYVCEKCNINLISEVPPAWQLAHASCSLQEIFGSLKFIHKEPTGYIKSVFSSSKLNFVEEIHKKKIILAYYLSEQFFHKRISFLWQEGQAAEVDLDWGRWIAMADESVAFYDAETQKMALPARIPLPKILDRALVLCSGLIPNEIRRENHNIKLDLPNLKYYAYHNVPQEIAEIVSKKISQNLSIARITNKSIEVC